MMNQFAASSQELSQRPAPQRESRGSLMLGVMVAVAWAGAVVPVHGGEFNRVLSIGDKAPTWKSLEGVDGKQHSSAALSDAAVTVVAFTCNTCPYAVDVQKRLVALDAWLGQREGQLVAINVNKVEGDSLPDMRERAEEVGFKFPYLYDPSQQIAKDFGATTTPEFFVLNKNREVVYMGSLDDSPDGKDVTERYVRDAVSAVLAGTEVKEAETVPIGCRIRFERQRRGRGN